MSSPLRSLISDLGFWKPRRVVQIICCMLRHVWLFVTPWTVASGLFCPWNFPGKNTKVGCHFILQGIFLTQGQNPHLLHFLDCRWILYLLSHWGGPRVTNPNTSSLSHISLKCCDSIEWYYDDFPRQNTGSQFAQIVPTSLYCPSL